MMKRIAVSLFAIATAAGVVAAWAQTSTRTDLNAPQSAKEVRGASPYIEIKNEPAPKLIVDPPLPDLLDQGVVWIQWRAENVHIVPVFGKGALNASPRVGHLHVHVDDLPWWWADASNINTIDLAGMPPGPPQDSDRIGERQPRGLPRTVQNRDVHRSQGCVSLSLSLRVVEDLLKIQSGRDHSEINSADSSATRSQHSSQHHSCGTAPRLVLNVEAASSFSSRLATVESAGANLPPSVVEMVK